MESECKGLTQEQLNISNGCGSSFWLAYIFRIPKFISQEFYCCCNFHDVNFINGTTIQEKQIADDKLYDCLYYSAYHSPNWQKWFKIKIADLVYWCLSTKLSDIAYEKAKPKKFYFN